MKIRNLIVNSFALTSLAMLCLFSGSASAQLYKWVGADGKVTYSDVPPPPGAKQLSTKASSGESGGVPLPEDLAAAVSKNPVTLYTGATCVPCNEGRTLLKQMGIPFSEKTVSSNDDIDKLKKVSGELQLPLLVISNSKFRGFNDAEWRVALSSAGYPETNKLPKNYRYPAAEPASPPPAPVKKAGEDDGLPKLPPPSESGIRF
ncbi:MAG: glutaredoxin family protein [Pseudomonadota bacterium]